MGHKGTPKAELVLSDDERETLERWARRQLGAVVGVAVPDRVGLC